MYLIVLNRLSQTCLPRGVAAARSQFCGNSTCVHLCLQVGELRQRLSD
jgi:hypothetical protein